jgi:hypothetical protein
MLASIGQPRDLQEQKKAAALALAALSRRIVVFIDDLDRLEPTEIAEVLRLVRAVADFPNVIYVLSYDSNAVTSALEAVLEIEDGTEYLEKFIQVNFKGRVEDGRGSLGPKASAPFPISAHRTGGPDFRSPALRLASPQGPQRGGSGQAF